MNADPVRKADIKIAPNEALYLYALHPSDVAVGSTEGLSGGPVRSLVCTSRVHAVVDVVPRSAWAGENGEENLKSLAWVAPRATLHEEIVEAVMETGPSYPARFATLFSSARRLTDVVDREEDTLLSFFEQVRDADEWSVKLLLDREAATSHLAGGDDEPETGTAYLQQKKRRKDARDEVEAWLDEEAGTIADALLPHSRDAVMLPARDRPDDPREVSAHLAFLVPDAHAETFFDALQASNQRLDGTGLQVECKGPWPPYSFRPSISDA
ncbi:GvpL/GvpF family gas vesicle protein [Longibacter sp.]|uniref:GvpL/GvpF family gas vesicle protein n=1 Tax=Longibacter sp. TaxID=2045415 RepID=UPI003EB6A88A